MLFSNVPGQDAAKEQLAHAFASARLPHALRLEGGEGLGHLAFALALVQRLNCQTPTGLEPCGQCQQCRLTAQMQHPDVAWIYPVVSKGTSSKPTLSEDYLTEFRAAFPSNPFLTPEQWAKLLDAENKQLNIPIAEIRELQKKVYLKPFLGQQKAVVIWGAEKMNTEAANAFLKLLEEPPDRTTLVLIVEGSGELLPTLVSRTQAISLRRVEKLTLSQFLVEHHGLSEAVAIESTLLSEGHIARALEIAQQTDTSFFDDFQQWMRLCYEGKLLNLNEWCAQQSRRSREHQKLFLRYSVLRLRDVAMVGLGISELAFVSSHEREFLNRFSGAMRPEKAQTLTAQLEETQYFLRRNLNPLMAWVVLSLHVHETLRYRG